MPIRALPIPSTIQLSSGQVLLDPISIVKELLDNALDANATSISIEIAPNTTDFVQVRDNGVGIAPEDRCLLGRRFCTSKIRTMEDVRLLGGKTLGFRGEALSSLVAIAEQVHVTTRIEGEIAGVKIPLNEHAKEQWTLISHPPGTTVRAVHLFHALPVRKQTAEKDAIKVLGRIRTLLHSYIFARPYVRLSMKVHNSKSQKFNFTYAPAGTGPTVDDAVTKLLGLDCANQCTLSVIEDDGYKLKVFHPTAHAEVAKVIGRGQFISVDSRPVSVRTGTLREIVAKYRSSIRQHSSLFGEVKDPFLCLNIICPEGSYDANVEPMKNDMIFEHNEHLLDIVSRCFDSIYPVPVAISRDIESMEPLIRQQPTPLPSSSPSRGFDVEAALPQSVHPSTYRALNRPRDVDYSTKISEKQSRRREDGDIRSLLPKRLTVDSNERDRGRLQRCTRTNERASTNLYDVLPPIPNSSLTVDMPRNCADERQVELHPALLTAQPKFHSAEDPVQVEHGDSTGEEINDSFSRPVQQRSLSRARNSKGTYDIQCTISGTEVTKALDSVNRLATAIPDIEVATEQIELCRLHAAMWSTILVDLLRIRWNGKCDHFDLEYEVMNGLLYAQLLDEEG